MRDLSSNIYEATVKDGDENHVILYRRPTNQEHAAYGATLMKRRGRKIVSSIMEARVKFGLRIIEGFKKGTIGYAGRPISSDPGDPDYREDWKKLLEDHLPDVVGAIGRHAFEGTMVVVDGIESILDDLEEFEDDSDPTTLSEKSGSF